MTHRKTAAAVELLLFTIVALWVTWPLAANLSTSVPLACEQTPAVPLLNLWTLWWNVDRINHAYAGYWNAPIFYPAQDAFAYSEPQVLAGQFAWLLWPILPSPECVYNVMLLGHLVLNAWSFYKLLRAWHLAWPPSLVAALMVETMPIVHWQMGIVQLVPLWGIIWTIRFLYEFTRRPSSRSSIGLGLAAACTYLLCSYYGVMLSLLLVATTPILATRQICKPRAFLYLGVTVAVILAFAMPVALFQWRTVQHHGIVPPHELVMQLSVRPQHFLRTPWQQVIPIPGVSAATAESPWALSPGTLKLIVAAGGCWFGLSRKRNRGLVLFLSAIAILGAVLAMGPLFAWNSWSVADVLHYYPGYSQLRNVYRFAVFTQLATIALVGFGLEWLWRWLKSLSRKTFGPGSTSDRIRVVTWSAAALLLLLEVFPASPELYASQRLSPPSWVRWIREHTSSDDVLAIFPFPATDSLVDYVPTAHWMYWQRYHGRRMINGYSGFFPTSIAERELRLRRFPDHEVLVELARTGVDVVVVQGELNQQLQVRNEVTRARTLERVSWDPAADVGVYRINR